MWEGEMGVGVRSCFGSISSSMPRPQVIDYRLTNNTEDRLSPVNCRPTINLGQRLVHSDQLSGSVRKYNLLWPNSNKRSRRCQYCESRRQASVNQSTNIILAENSQAMFSNLKKMLNVRIDYPPATLFPLNAAKPEEVEHTVVTKSKETVNEELSNSLPNIPAHPTVAKETRLLERLHSRFEQHFSDGHAWFYTTPRGHLEIFSKITEY